MKIPSANNQAHQRYLYSRSQLPAVQAAADKGEQNVVFTQLLSHHECPVALTFPAHDGWIAPDTWQMIDRRTAALKRHATQDKLSPLRKEIRQMISRDQDARLQKTGNKIQAHLDANEMTDAWRLVKVWYRHYAKAAPLTPMDLHWIGQEYRTLYMQQPPPPGDPIWGMVTFDISDEVPAESEIVVALRSLRLGWALGPSGMTVEDLKKWYADRETNQEPWLLVIRLMTHAFQTGIVPTRARSNTLVLIPKPEPGQVRGIGLLEPIWKLISVVVNHRLMMAIKFHDDLHGFLPG